jgi:pilus biogenesis lipoprotein CpaD
MPGRRIHIRGAKLALILPAALLAGCQIDQTEVKPVDVVISHTFDSANWQQNNAVIRAQVEPIALVHVMNFAPGETQLSDEEIGRLRDFLQQSGIHEKARIEVDGPRESGGYFDPLTKSRLEEIQAELSGLGLRSQIPARPVTLLTKPEDSIAVTVTRAMIIPPDCSAPQPAPATRPNYTYSCANAANLGSMVSDPVDLAVGRSLSPADATAAVTSIDRYRKNATIDPTAVKTAQ